MKIHLSRDAMIPDLTFVTRTVDHSPRMPKEDAVEFANFLIEETSASFCDYVFERLKEHYRETHEKA
jgi:hypothetical protein